MMGICRFCRQGAMVKDAVGPICPDCIEEGYAESTDKIDTTPEAVDAALRPRSHSRYRGSSDGDLL